MHQFDDSYMQDLKKCLSETDVSHFHLGNMYDSIFKHFAEIFCRNSEHIWVQAYLGVITVSIVILLFTFEFKSEDWHTIQIKQISPFPVINRLGPTCCTMIADSTTWYEIKSPMVWNEITDRLDWTSIMPLRRWDSDESLDIGLRRYDPTSSESGETLFCILKLSDLTQEFACLCDSVCCHALLSIVSTGPAALPRNESAATTDSSSDGSDEDSDDSDHSPLASGPAHVDLTLERLHSLHSTESTEDSSYYAKAGRSKTRVVGALNKPICKCQCRLPLGILLKVVAAFWLLAKPTQDALLWSLQHEAGTHKKKQWFIAGGFVWQKILILVFRDGKWFQVQ